MEPLSQGLNGRVYQRGEQFALLVDEALPALYVRYALIVQGPEHHVLPAFVLDDWGRERSTLGLYEWIYREGQRFPRAELFGFEMSGATTQYFLRDLEIFFKYPCYAYPSAKAGVADGVRIGSVLLPDPLHEEAPVQVSPPERAGWPFVHADTTWRRVNPRTLEDFGFAIYPF